MRSLRCHRPNDFFKVWNFTSGGKLLSGRYEIDTRTRQIYFLFRSNFLCCVFVLCVFFLCVFVFILVLVESELICQKLQEADKPVESLCGKICSFSLLLMLQATLTWCVSNFLVRIFFFFWYSMVCRATQSVVRCFMSADRKHYLMWFPFSVFFFICFFFISPLVQWHCVAKSSRLWV